MLVRVRHVGWGEERREHEREEDNGHVDEEDGAPPEVFEQHTADHRPEGCTTGGDRRPDAERQGALAIIVLGRVTKLPSAPWLAVAIISIAMPARISGEVNTAPCSRLGPAMMARCGSQSTMRAPIAISLSTKNIRDFWCSGQEFNGFV